LGLSQCDGIFGRGTEKAVKSFQELFGLEADGIVGPATWKALRTAGTKTPPQPLPPVLVHIQSLGHKIMWDGDYHLNLFGIRNPDPMSNSFDDMMGCAYTVDSMWKVHYWPATCDPGTYHLQNPSRVDGTAILAPGQYEDVWTIDLHAGKYEALCQRNGPVVVFRDSDKDYLLEMDEGSQVEGYFGINLHRSSLRTDTVEEVEDAEVNRWSAGCQVHARNDGFNEMMGLARMQVEKLGRTTFTYTLLNQWWE
jgi:hypothetical protein